MCPAGLLMSLFCIASVIVVREVNDIGQLTRNINKGRNYEAKLMS